MRTRFFALAAAVGLLFGVPSCAVASTSASLARPHSATASGSCGSLATGPSYRHVVWIWMENHSYNSIIGSSQAPYINSLARHCGLATNYHNISHPSLPNYIAATSGLGYTALQRFKPDCDPTTGCITHPGGIFGQGESWRAYQESMPSNCRRTDSGEYAVRHNPPPYFVTLKGCLKNDVPYSQLASDLASKRLPAFSFITPNLIDDMHDGTVAEGDSWLAKHLPAILNSPQYGNGSTAVFITWDEGEGGSASECATNTTDAGCHVATIVVSPSTKPGTRSARLFNHYSLLGTAEELLHLPMLGRAGTSSTMTSAFHL